MLPSKLLFGSFELQLEWLWEQTFVNWERLVTETMLPSSFVNRNSSGLGRNKYIKVVVELDLSQESNV